MSKRSLILAGGGLKVGYQAGVLQVWLDEAGLKFDHADGASGGILNIVLTVSVNEKKVLAAIQRALTPGGSRCEAVASTMLVPRRAGCRSCGRGWLMPARSSPNASRFAPVSIWFR